MLIRRSLRGVMALTIASSLAGGLAACGASSGGASSGGASSGEVSAGAEVAPGTPAFAAPPGLADCSRVDVAGLRSLVTSEVPEPSRVLTYADPTHPRQTWAGCAGLAPETSDAAEAAAGEAAVAVAPKAKPTPDGTRATREGSSGAALWIVRYATSSAATRDRPLLNPYAGEAGYTTLVRGATLGDAQARVELGVQADTHLTLVLVSVFDPRTGRNAAECGISGVAGGSVDRAVSWCLRAVAGQLMRRSVGSSGRSTGGSGASGTPAGESLSVPGASA